MTNGHDRRGFLQLAGAGGAAALAGCTELGLLSGDDADDSLTVTVGPDQDEVDELVEAIESEEMDPLEAQQRHQELLGEAASTFEERAENEDDLSIEESTEEMGLFRVETEGGSLLDALRDGEVTAIQIGDAYDRILEQQEQQQQQQQQQQPEEPPEGGDLDENASEDEEETDESDDGEESDGENADAGDEDEAEEDDGDGTDDESDA